MFNNQLTIDGQAGTIQDSGWVKMGQDSALNVLFYKKAVHDPVKSREIGRPWHRSMEYVRIQHPGEKDFSDRPATDMDKARFPQHWQRYLRGQEQVPDGTPVDVLFPQSPEIAANLHSVGVHTVEQLSGLTEHGTQTIGMGATMWRNKAREFLDASKGGAGMHRLQKQLEDKDNKIDVLSNQVASLRTQVDRLMAQHQQNIPSGMIPREPLPIAQTARMTFSNDGPSDGDLPPADDSEMYSSPEPVAARGSEPLFIEPSGDDEESSDPETAQEPRRRGRPPGSRNRVQA